MKKATYWPQAVKALRREPALKRVIDQRPGIQLQSRGTSFAVLARAIVGQQISVKAAQSVWKRVVAATGGVTADRVLACAPETLRACGLSGMKVNYVLDLAAHFTDGRIASRRLPHMSDEAIIETLSAVKGIGRWSAEMFLMFHLLRPNVWPVDDLGLRNGIDQLWPLKAGAAPRTKSDYFALGEQFSPWRSVACWYVWRSLEPKPDDY